jgi:hypothetical protein
MLMRNVLTFPGIRLITFYLVMVMSGLFMAPAAVHAAFVSSAPAAGEFAAGDIDAVRASLQKELVAERLSALGLDADEIGGRLDALSADELEAVSADAERIQAGGDALGGLVSLAILVLIIVLILKVMDKEVVIK